MIVDFMSRSMKFQFEKDACDAMDLLNLKVAARKFEYDATNFHRLSFFVPET